MGKTGFSAVDESVFRLVYVSQASGTFSQDDFENIAASAKKNNGKLNITGMLICCGDEFMQIIEGYEPQVKMLCDRISRDRRHTSLTIISADRVKERRFSEWSMGCFHFSSEDLPEGFIFETVDGRRRLRPDAFLRAEDLLQTFYRERLQVGAGGGFASYIEA